MYNLFIVEPDSYEEVAKQEVWGKAITEEKIK